MPRVLLIGHLIISSLFCSAQERTGPRVTGRIEGKNSFVRTEYAMLLGFKLGLEFRLPLQAGLGYQWIVTRLSPTFYDPSKHNGLPIPCVRMYYFSLYADYRLYSEGNWEFIIPAQVGFGESAYRSDDGTRFATGFILPVEVGIDVNYHPLPYLGIGVGLGHRVMIVDNSQMESRYDAPYYQTRLKIGFGEIYRRMVRKR
jgi:hypothetical protein